MFDPETETRAKVTAPNGLVFFQVNKVCVFGCWWCCAACLSVLHHSGPLSCWQLKWKRTEIGLKENQRVSARVLSTLWLTAGSLSGLFQFSFISIVCESYSMRWTLHRPTKVTNWFNHIFDRQAIVDVRPSGCHGDVSLAGSRHINYFMFISWSF